MGRWVVLCIMLFSVQAEDFFFPSQESEEENLEEEVEFPGGGDSSKGVGGKGRTPAEASRKPFTVQVFDEVKQRWREPKDEAEYNKHLNIQFEKAWLSAVMIDLDEAMSSSSHHTSKQISAGNVYQ